MATRDDIYTAIRNADAAGDSEAVAKLGAYLQTMDAPTGQNKMGRAASLYAGAIKPFQNIGKAAINATGMMTPEIAAALENDNLARKRSPHPNYVLGGNVAGTLPTLAVGGGTGLAAKGATMVAQGALGGALLSDADTAGGVAEDAGWGAAGGVLAGGALHGAGKIVRGFNIIPDAAKLKAMGVKTTIGQEFGGQFQKLEDRLAGFPIVGAPIRELRRAGNASVMVAAGNKALAKIGQRVDRGVTDGRQIAEDVLGKATDNLDAVIGKMTASVDPTFNAALARARAHPAAAELIDDEILPRINNGSLEGRSIQEIKEILDDEARKLGMQPGMRRAMKAVKGLRNDLLDAVGRTSPAMQADYAKARAAYGMAKTVAKASEKSTSDGIPTPRQLGQAVREGARRFGPRDAYSKGQSPLQDLTDTAARVLPSTIPDPGTAGQLAMGSLLLNPVKYGPAALGATGAGLLYSPVGQAALRGALTGGPKRAAVAGFLGRSGRLAPAAVPPLLMRND